MAFKHYDVGSSTNKIIIHCNQLQSVEPVWSCFYGSHSEDYVCIVKCIKLMNYVLHQSLKSFFVSNFVNRICQKQREREKSNEKPINFNGQYKVRYSIFGLLCNKKLNRDSFYVEINYSKTKHFCLNTQINRPLVYWKVNKC